MMQKVIVVPKLSMVEVDLHRYGLTEEELMRKYAADQKDVERIFESHYAQKAAVELLKERFPDGICYREGFNRHVAQSADLVIAAGGDDHFKYVTHYLNGTPILGLNTDPKRSRGELLEDNVKEALAKLEKGEFEIKQETRIEALLNGKVQLPAMSIYSVGRDEDSDGNFRYKIQANGSVVTHPVTSGIIVYAGNGTGDWAKGAGRYAGTALPHLNPTEGNIAWVVREPNDTYELLYGIITEENTLTVTCHKDDSKATPDAIREHKIKLKSGDKLEFRASEVPLYHVRMK
jgi:hypothetical protein